MRHARNTVVLFTLTGTIFLGCSHISNTTQNPAANANIQVATDIMTTAQLTDLVRKFSTDDGAAGHEAWRMLQARPRPEIIQSLEKLRATLPAKDSLRPQFAFTLCNLDQDYTQNVDVIKSALSKSTVYEGFYADDAQALLSRLVERGDKEILRTLFAASPWSDGALSEGLAETFARELRSDPDNFLVQLQAVAPDTRRGVYSKIESSGMLTDSDVNMLRSHLSAIRSDSPAAATAKELLSSSIFKDRS